MHVWRLKLRDSISHTIAAVLLVPIAEKIGSAMEEPHPRLLIMVSWENAKSWNFTDSAFEGYRLDLFCRNGSPRQWLPKYDSVSMIQFQSGVVVSFPFKQYHSREQAGSAIHRAQ